MKQQNQVSLSRQRALVIMKVQSGELTAAAGARQLGVSRKTYYQWERRALEGMMQALENGQSGRPSTGVDLEKQELEAKITQMAQEIETAKQSRIVRNVLDLWEKQQAKLKREPDAKKKRKPKDK